MEVEPINRAQGHESQTDMDELMHGLRVFAVNTLYDFGADQYVLSHDIDVLQTQLGFSPDQPGKWRDPVGKQIYEPGAHPYTPKQHLQTLTGMVAESKLTLEDKAILAELLVDVATRDNYTDQYEMASVDDKGRAPFKRRRAESAVLSTLKERIAYYSLSYSSNSTQVTKIRNLREELDTSWAHSQNTVRRLFAVTGTVMVGATAALAMKKRLHQEQSR